MKRLRLNVLLGLIFVVMSLTGATQHVNANDSTDDMNAVSSADLIIFVEHYADEGQLTSELAVRALTMHLTAVQHYEQQGQKEKVIEHLNSFKLLLDQQMELETMTEQAYNSLMSHTEAVILQWNVVAIITDGEAQAVIVTASDASDQIQAAAEELAEYVSKSTGAELPILTPEENWPEDLIPIYVGLPAPNAESHMADQLDGFVEDGYVIHPTESDITIMGPEEIGTQYGVYEFLERYIGVRWLMPGEVGEDVPQHTNLEIPIQDVRDEPIYLSRNMYPLHFEGAGADLPERYEWGVHNRLREQNNGGTHNV